MWGVKLSTGKGKRIERQPKICYYSSRKKHPNVTDFCQTGGLHPHSGSYAREPIAI